MPRARQRGRRPGHHSPDPSADELLPDPAWVDIQAIPVNVERYNLFEPPRAFYDSMVGDSAAWAMGVGLTVARCVASAVARTVMPWLVDSQLWRRHAAEFFDRLCAHRAHRAQRIDRRLELLTQQLAECTSNLCKLGEDVALLERTMAETRAELRGIGTRMAQLEASFQPVQELALLRPATVIAEDGLDRVRRAHYRAVSSRSPDPRTAMAAMRRVEQMDRAAMARYEAATQPWTPPAEDPQGTATPLGSEG